MCLNHPGSDERGMQWEYLFSESWRWETVKKQRKTMEWIKGFEKWFLNVLLCPYHLTAHGRPSMRSFAAVLLVIL